MTLALPAGDAPIHVPGLIWLHPLAGGRFVRAGEHASAWDQTLAWGLTR